MNLLKNTKIMKRYMESTRTRSIDHVHFLTAANENNSRANDAVISICKRVKFIETRVEYFANVARDRAPCFAVPQHEI